MKQPHRLAALVLSVFAVVIGCGDDDEGERGGPPGGASGNAGRGGSSGATSLGGATQDGGAGASERGGVSGEGGMETTVAAGRGGEGPASGGGAGGEAGQPRQWLAFQPWVEDEYPHDLFLAEVPSPAEPVQVARGVDFWQWSPDGSRLIYATPATYGEAPNAAFSVAVSRTGSLGVPQPLHEPLEDGAYIWRLSVSPEGKTLALQLYQDDVSTWYLRPVDGGVGEWRPVGEPVSGPEAPWVWSPDGARAAIIQRQDATHDVLSIVDVRTGESTERTFGTLRPFQWSADGSRFFVEAVGPGPGERELYAVDADDESSVVRLTDPAVHSGFEPGKFAASADGDTVMFAAFSGGVLGGSVFMKQVESAEPAAQLVGSNPQQLAWSESGQRFLYTAYSDSSLLSLYVAPQQGEEPVALNPQGTAAGCSAPPCLREAGEATLFMVFDANYTGNQLYDIDLASSSPSMRLLTALSEETVIDALVVAPDPSQVVLGTKDAAGKQVIYWVDRSATPPTVTPLLEQTGDTSFDSPALRWSPDSRWLALPAYDTDGYASLFTVPTGRAPAALSAPLTPLDSKITAVPAEWRPQRP